MVFLLHDEKNKETKGWVSVSSSKRKNSKYDVICLSLRWHV